MFAVVNVLSDTCQVSKQNRANTFRLAVFHELGRLFVEGIFDLVINLPDTLPLPTGESPARADEIGFCLSNLLILLYTSLPEVYPKSQPS